MSENLTEAICVIDKSASMNAIRHDAIRMFNAFLAEQKAQPGRCRLTLILFDYRVITLCTAQDIQTIEPLTEYNYILGNGTALLDAMKHAIQSTRARLRPGKHPIGFTAEANPPKVIFAIVTDGEENSSRYATRSEVSELVALCRNAAGWDFVFLGANQDAVLAGARLGIDPSKSYNFQATGPGIAAAGKILSGSISQIRMAPDPLDTPPPK